MTNNLLSDMFAAQKIVEEQWGRLVDPTNPEHVSQYVREVVLCASDELHEVLAEVHWKPWKQSRGIKDMAAYREELADLMHFVIDLYLAGGLTAQDMYMDYMSKHDENVRRRSDQDYIQS